MKQRIISALIALIICIPIILINGYVFELGVCVIATIALFEILRAGKKNINIPEYIKVLGYILLILFIIMDKSITLKIFISMLILGIPIIFIDKEKYNIESLSYLLFNIIFLGTVFSIFIEIRQRDLNEFIFIFLITILTDTFAYIGGKLFGKHKLIPKVSPKKTIEGSLIGSVFGTIIPSIFYIYMVDPGANIVFVVLMVFVLSILGQLGDLFFSSIKRFYKIKDFSNIMPGHGGILDRLDSSIFVIIGYILIISFM